MALAGSPPPYQPTVRTPSGPRGMKPGQGTVRPPRGPRGMTAAQAYARIHSAPNVGGAAVGAAVGHNPVSTLQMFLRNHGYSIDVDGVRGPQTNAALAAYHKGISARAWNAQNHGRPTGPSHPVVRASRPVPGVTRASAGGGGRVVGGNSQAANVPAAAGIATTDPNANAAAGGDMTAEQIAQAQIDAAYGPQVAEIQRAMAQAQAQGAQNIVDLRNWYGQVGQTNQAATESNLAGTQALIGAEGAADANILGLFGGPGANPSAGEAAAYTGVNRAELANIGAAQQGFDTSMSPIIQLQGADAVKAAQNTTGQNLAQLSSQLQDMQNQRSSAYISALNDVKKQQFDTETQRLQNEAAQQQLDLERQLAGPKVTEANLSNAATRQQIRLRNQQAVQDAKRFGISLSQARANLANTNASTARIKAELTKAGKGGINLTDPTQRAQLTSSLRSSIQTKAGTWRMHPGLAQKNLNIALQQLGLGNDPNAQAIAQSLLAETVNNSHARGQWGQFNYANGKIVKTGKKFKPKPKK